MAAKKEITLAEFRAWLEGVEELQTKSWSPDAKQWKLIRAKIKTITVEQPMIDNQRQHQHQPVGQLNNSRPSSLPPGIPAPPMLPGSVPHGDITVTPEAKKATVGMEVKTTTNGEKVLKTADVDGEYQTQFG